MVVTDLHGDYAAYSRYRDHFLALRAEGLAETFVLCGDYLHSDGPPEADGSLQIALDLLRLQRELGPNLSVLLGNHELCHLYGISISKGHQLYGPHFERAMGRHRAAIVQFLDALPFYIRTRAGVTLAHAGACQAAATLSGMKALRNYAHQAELAKVEAHLVGQDRAALRAGLGKLSGQPYADLVADNLGIADPGDPRYDDVLRGTLVMALSPAFQSLWEALFNKNELEYGAWSYAGMLTTFLNSLSDDYVPQRAIVSGHIHVTGGHALVAEKQLRLASWAHARPPEAGEYLLFDAAQPVAGVRDLLAGLHTLP
jgi:hypothetical protein